MTNLRKMSNEPELKILHISSAHTWRGGEQQIVNLVEGLSTMGAKLKQKVFCAQNSALSVYCYEHTIPCTTAIKRGSLSIRFIKSLHSEIKQESYDLLHVHDSHAHTALVIAHQLAGLSTPIILHRRVDFPIAKSLLSSYKYKYRHIRKVICVSHAIEEVVRKSLNLPTTIIHSSNRKEEIQKYKRSNILRSEFGWPENTPLIGNIAALADHKDYPTFIRTALLLHRSRPELRFVLIGEGKERAMIKQLIVDNKAESYIKLTGFRDDIKEVIHDLDIFLMTSKMEGLGSTLLDVFAAGIPVVATNAGGIGELVIDEQSGLLCPVADFECLHHKVLRLLNEPSTKESILRGGQQILALHQYTSMAAETYEVYRDVLN